MSADASEDGEGGRPQGRGLPAICDKLQHATCKLSSNVPMVFASLPNCMLQAPYKWRRPPPIIVKAVSAVLSIDLVYNHSVHVELCPLHWSNVF